MTTISVCLATFNGERYLREQVESILSQLGPDDELIASDNGSTDGTLLYLRSIPDRRLHVVTFTDQRGPVANFENVLRLARRDVLVLADQDDVWMPDRLARVRHAFTRSAHIPMCLVADGIRIDGEGRTIAPSNLDVLGFRPGLWKNLGRNSFMGCTMAIRRELLAVALPFPAGIPMHDSWLGILAGWVGTVEVDRRISYAYRVHGRNLSHQKRPVMRKFLDRVILAKALLLRLLAISHGRSPPRQRGEVPR